MSVHTSSSKKRKSASVAVEKTPSKKAKRDTGNAPKDKHSKKGKSKETEFHVVHATLDLSISPIFTNNPRAGCDEMLDSMIMRYIPALQGVVLSHSNLSFLDQKAVIKADCPFLVCRVAFDATVWSPRVGMQLEGRISVCSPDHISIIIHRTFNVSIPRHHIPQDEWEFEYGPAENDPEYAPDALGDDAEAKHEEAGGRWIHRLTAQTIGDEAGYLKFTVVGLTVANEMLSVIGSLQPDPFSPVHSVEKPQKKTEVEEQEFDDEEPGLPSDGEDVDSDVEADPFDALGKHTAAKEDPAEEPKKKRKADGGESEKKKKSKRKHDA